ncbi:EF-hand domain-containing protein [Aphelenchoides bicaudatus]|nr:EF-hand domain-containing protein [Aphelenchoides bicaudatus]
MNRLLPLFLIFGSFAILYIQAPPPNRQAAQTADQTTHAPNQQQAGGDPNHHQQQQQEDSKPSLKILEGNEKFRERIKGMNEDEIKTGKIADHIDDLGKEVFDELTKAKLAELERLREQIDSDLKKHGDASKIEVPDHIDVYQWENFHKEDLRKLITKTVSHMEKIDEQRREQFKEYELKKKAEEDHKLAQMSPDQRAAEQHKLDESKKRHNEHEKVKHPGGRQQLEEVWEENDHMSKDNFDPKTFFALHDLNGDGYWNDDELEALFQIELEKVYNETDPDDDPKERIEEMYRMRDHVVKQMDKNEDRLISLEEFLSDNEATEDGKADPGWEDLGEQKLYTDEELKKFEEEYARTQGWGEHAYDPATPPPINANVHQQQQPNQVPPAGQAQYQPPPQANAMPPQQPIVPEKVHKPVDPVYGI